MTISSCDIHLEILYGSQTGCAEDVAKRISREGWRRHFKTRVKAMDDFDPKDILNTTHVIFVCSTTGQGVEPDNMRKFWKFLLRKSLPQGILSSLEYAVFGLGDSSYEKFNFPAKKLYRRVEQLGGSPLISLGEGDDQHYLGLDGALDPWLKTLWQNLLQKYPLKEGYSVIPPQPSFDVKLSEYNASDNDRDSIEKQFYPGMRRMVVKENNRITSPDHFQDVRRLTFNTNDDSLSWNPGDCAFLYPQNMENNVEAFLSLMGWHPIADKELYITASPGVDYPARLPSRTTLRKLSTYFFDISGVPRRSFFEMASYFSTHEDEREKLREFASAEGQDDMHSYCTRPKRTLLEVLGDFTSIKDVPLNYIFDVFPPLRPRYFSISSHPYVSYSIIPDYNN
ncbi:NAPDH-dependent diflavin reductase [Mycoemilia scoparia]|uniref:NAPDH-dependent diflavin reductase n=1 Tax=Mycoemilia scoparia TaxID=417184 RepID=A0A9W8DX05_9FUNG|nr:NAPDH-dependent diflavin reductase [Mycoemilia scoparia]